MTSLEAILRDADPLDGEPPRAARRRLLIRAAILDAAHVDSGVSQRHLAVAALVVLLIGGVAFSAFQWSDATVAVVAAIRFDLRLAEEHPQPGLREAVVVGTGRNIYLHSEPLASNSDIIEAHIVQGDDAAVFGVSVTFSADGAARLSRATQGHIGRPLAILIDGDVVAAPIVRSAMTTSAVISGHYARPEAERLVRGILGR